MEREPEEHSHAQHGKQRIHTLANLLGVGSNFIVVDLGSLHLLDRIGIDLARSHENQERRNHSQSRCDERIVNARVETLKIVRAERSHVGHLIAVERVVGQRRKVLHIIALQRVVQETVTQTRKVGIVDETVEFQHRTAQQRSHERRNHTADVDENVENLKTAIATRLGNRQFLGTLLGGLSLEVVIHLTHDGLQIALEQTITGSNEQEGKARQYKHPRGNCARVATKHGQRQDGIARCHDDKTRHDGSLEVLQLVGHHTAGQAEHVDAEVEDGVNPAGSTVADAEFRCQEQQQHCVHNVVTESLAHV